MTQLALYKYLFVTELLIAEGFLAFRFPRRKHFVWRLLGGILGCYLFASLFTLFDNISSSWQPAIYNGWYVSVMFLVLFSATFGCVALCFDVPFKHAFFCCLTAYTAQHLSYEIFKIILVPFSSFSAGDLYGNALVDFTDFNGITAVFVLVYLDIYIVVYAVMYFIFGKRMGCSNGLEIKNGSMLLFLAVILLVDIMLNAFTVYISERYNKLYDIIIGIYNSLCCVLVFYIQLSLTNVKNMRDELETVSNLLYQSHRQYEMRKEEIDLINIKCHDLKRRIEGYAGVLDAPTVKEISDLVSIYETNVKTGNEVVDIILTEKSLMCRSKDITLSCMADCSALGFMSDGDLYALFGNIVDNAVEAVSEMSDSEKKGISLNIHNESGCVSVMSENYFEGGFKLDKNGLPVTTKEDKNYHGFGLKSVRVLAEKYGGSMSIVTDDDIFRINVLLPIPKKPA